MSYSYFRQDYRECWKPFIDRITKICYLNLQQIYKSIDGEGQPNRLISESTYLVEMCTALTDCRSGADFLNPVGKYGNARYSV